MTTNYFYGVALNAMKSIRRFSGNVPVELIDLHRWVGWKIESIDKGEVRKTPFNPETGKRASVSDPATWGTFSQAVAWQSPCAPNSGIGFVLTETDPYVCFSCNYCRDPKTGQIDEKILRYVQFLDSYTEISVDGKGLQVLVKVHLPVENRQNGLIKISSHHAVFPITGKHLAGTPLEIHERTEQVCALWDAEFQTPQFRSKKTKGILADEQQNQKTEADRAIHALRAKWTQDAHQLKRVFIIREVLSTGDFQKDIIEKDQFHLDKHRSMNPEFEMECVNFHTRAGRRKDFPIAGFLVRIETEIINDGGRRFLIRGKTNFGQVFAFDLSVTDDEPID